MLRRASPRLGTPARSVLICGCVLSLLLTLGYFLAGWHVRASASITVQKAERALRQRDNARAREALKWLLWFQPSEERALLT